MNLIRFLIKYAPGRFILATVAGIFSGACAAGLIALINAVLTHTAPAPSILFLFLGLCFLRLTTNLMSQVMIIHLAEGAVLDLRLRLSRRILASSLRHLEELGGHRLLAVLTEDIKAISDVAIILPFVFINAAILVGCQIYLLSLSPKVFFICCGFFLLGVASYHLPTRVAFGYLRRARRQEDQLFNHFRAIIHGTKELKLHAPRRKSFLSEDLKRSALQHQRYNFRGNAVYAGAASWGQVLFFVCIGLLLFMLPRSGDISAPIVLGYTLTIIYSMTPLEYIMRMLPILSKATVALQTIENMGLSLVPERGDLSPDNGLSSVTSWKSLRLRAITHTYYQERDNRNFTLGPLDLDLRPGELVFLVGGNGSGKSTLAKLICGLYTPESGAIMLDQHLISDHNREEYRQLFSVVFSDFFVFERLLGVDAAVEQVQYYLSQLQLDHKVAIEHGNLSTTALSQGQRKRLALLTAYLEDREIYIFDEWAADQDPVFKKVFYTQILPDLKRRGKAVLVISHDDQYFDVADRKVKLEYGQVVEQSLMINLSG